MTLRSRAKKLAYLAGLTASVSLASLMISPKANAVTYTLLSSETESFGSTATDFNGTQQLTFSKYNSAAAGTNVSYINFTLTSNLSSSGSITGINGNSTQVEVQTEVKKFYFQNTLGNQITFINQRTPFLIADQYYGNVSNGENLTFGPQYDNSNSGFYSGTYNNTITISDNTMQNYLGSGNSILSAYTQIPVVTSSVGGNIQYQISTFGDAKLTVDYYGTPATPVPFDFSSDSVIIPCAGTLVGISLLKRKRQRVQA